MSAFLHIPQCLHSTHTPIFTFHTCRTHCLHSTHTPMSTFYTYPNIYIPHMPQCLHSTHTPVSAFYTYSKIYILHMPQCLQQHIPPMSASHRYSNICIPRISQCLHSTHIPMSAFHACQNVKHRVYRIRVHQIWPVLSVEKLLDRDSSNLRFDCCWQSFLDMNCWF